MSHLKTVYPKLTADIHIDFSEIGTSYEYPEAVNPDDL